MPCSYLTVTVLRLAKSRPCHDRSEPAEHAAGNNIVKNLVYSGSKQNVKLTMVNGKVLYEDQKFDIGFDPADIYRRANEIIRRMK